MPMARRPDEPSTRPATSLLEHLVGVPDFEGRLAARAQTRMLQPPPTGR